MKPNVWLINSVRSATTGGNIHRTVALVRAYEFAIERANHPRCTDRAREIRKAREHEDALYALLIRSRRGEAA